MRAAQTSQVSALTASAPRSPCEVGTTVTNPILQMRKLRRKEKLPEAEIYSL